jgi:hypothetical protein
MLFKSLLLSALAATGAVAKRSCGTSAPTDESNLIHQNFQIEEEHARRAGNFSIEAAISVKVYWHIVALDNTAAGGYLTQAQMDSQLAVLNNAYAPLGISFTTAGTDWTINTKWASYKSPSAMKSSLHKGTYSDLNVYFIPQFQYLGIATFPWENANNIGQDGIICLSSSVPGGAAPYDLGQTATHEAGHWFGLYHTFQGGCTGEGDYVSDTAAEASAAFGCEVGRDTCTATGLDPITNYMDYSDE